VRAAGGTAYFVIDQAVFDEVDAIYKSGKLSAGSRGPNIGAVEPAAKGRTLQELAAALKLPAATVSATYNRNAAMGEDVEFHKGADYLQALDKPPYYAYEPSVSDSSSVMTLGGLKTETVSGIMGWSYNSGISMGDCLFFGRTAGGHAADAGKSGKS
jgi:3-oxo-5alpha-steroid 4-dehydrogenase